MATTRILPLAAVTDVSPLAELMEQVWPGYYGAGGRGDAFADLSVRARDTGFPYGMVARVGANLVGTGALTAGDSFGAHPGEGPWLIGLVVHPDHRAKGVATALIAALESAARTNGAPAIYSTTQAAAGLLRARGWRLLRDVTDDQGAGWPVLSKPL